MILLFSWELIHNSLKTMESRPFASTGCTSARSATLLVKYTFMTRKSSLTPLREGRQTPSPKHSFVLVPQPTHGFRRLWDPSLHSAHIWIFSALTHEAKPLNKPRVICQGCLQPRAAQSSPESEDSAPSWEPNGSGCPQGSTTGI